MLGMKTWLWRWLSRRELRRATTWKSVENECGWSPRKSAEERFVKRYVEHQMAMFNILRDEELRKLNAQWDEHVELTRKANVWRLQNGMEPIPIRAKLF